MSKKEDKPKRRYKTGDWSYILTLGAALGLLATLLSAGWASQLEADFLSMLLFMIIAFIAIYARNVKVNRLVELLLTFGAAVSFYFGNTLVYPVVSTGLGQLNSSVGLTLIPPFQLSSSVQAGFSSPGPNVMTAVLVTVSAFIIVCLVAAASLRPGEGKRSVGSSVLAVGVMTLSVMTLIGAYLASTGQLLPVSSEIFPPLIPLAGEFWILAVVYLFIGIGLWYNVSVAWWIYIGAELVGVFVSLWFLNIFGIIFNAIVIVYLLLAHKGFGVNKIPGI